MSYVTAYSDAMENDSNQGSSECGHLLQWPAYHLGARIQRRLVAAKVPEDQLHRNSRMAIALPAKMPHSSACSPYIAIWSRQGAYPLFLEPCPLPPHIARSLLAAPRPHTVEGCIYNQLVIYIYIYIYTLLIVHMVYNPRNSQKIQH